MYIVRAYFMLHTCVNDTTDIWINEKGEGIWDVFVFKWCQNPPQKRHECTSYHFVQRWYCPAPTVVTFCLILSSQETAGWRSLPALSICWIPLLHDPRPWELLQSLPPQRSSHIKCQDGKRAHPGPTHARQMLWNCASHWALPTSPHSNVRLGFVAVKNAPSLQIDGVDWWSRNNYWWFIAISAGLCKGRKEGRIHWGSKTNENGLVAACHRVLFGENGAEQRATAVSLWFM